MFKGKVSNRTQPGFSFASLFGKLYVIGGFMQNKASNQVIAYDPISNDWNQGPSLSTPRISPKICSTEDKIFVFGGFQDTSDSLNSAEVFEPESRLWKELPQIPQPEKFLLGISYEGFKCCPFGVAAVGKKIFVVQCWYKWPYFLPAGSHAFCTQNQIWSNLNPVNFLNKKNTHLLSILKPRELDGLF
jgi:N-acetylneuraminic acid mutarotase